MRVGGCLFSPLTAVASLGFPFEHLNTLGREAPEQVEARGFLLRTLLPLVLATATTATAAGVDTSRVCDEFDNEINRWNLEGLELKN